MRWPKRSASSSPWMSSSSTANSSPPTRATTSDARTSLLSRRAVSRSTVSPAAWPNMSLRRLKWSMFMHSSAAGLLVAASSLSCSLSRSCVRLARPVSESTSASCCMRDCASCSSVMSVITPRQPWSTPDSSTSGRAVMAQRRRAPPAFTGMPRWRNAWPLPKACRSCTRACWPSASRDCCSNQPSSERLPAASPSRRISAASLGVMRTKRPDASVSHMTSADCDSKSFSSSATSCPWRSASRSARSAPAERRAPRTTAAIVTTV